MNTSLINFLIPVTTIYNIPINFSNESVNKCFISHQIIRKILLKVNSNKAQGPDGIHGQILKNCAISIAYPLSLIFKTSYNTGAIPKDWKHANVVPVFKKRV